MTYIYELPDWPKFTWNEAKLNLKLADIRHKQGRLLGRMEALGFDLQQKTFLEVLTTDVLKTSEIEGEFLNQDQVRSSVAKHLGLTISNEVPFGRDVDGIVEMLWDASQNFKAPLTKERLFTWHSWLFPDVLQKRHRVLVGGWRSGERGPMRVVSGAIGREKIHFEAPDAKYIEAEMQVFLEWFNTEMGVDPVLKAAISHFWFVTIHPFEDGNGRIARAIADMQLSRADGNAQRFYSMSARIKEDWRLYYNILESSQKGSLNITDLLYWFIESLDQSINSTFELLEKISFKVRFWDKLSQVSLNERQRLMLNKLLDGFEGKVTTQKWAKICKSSHDTALRDIQDLINKNIIAKEQAGGRSSSYGLVALAP